MTNESGENFQENLKTNDWWLNLNNFENFKLSLFLSTKKLSIGNKRIISNNETGYIWKTIFNNNDWNFICWSLKHKFNLIDGQSINNDENIWFISNNWIELDFNSLNKSLILNLFGNYFLKKPNWSRNENCSTNWYWNNLVIFG